MKIKNIIKNILTENFISKNVQIGYHRTHDIKSILSIGSKGFIKNDGLYGEGVYNVLDEIWLLNERAYDLYGPYIIKSQIKINNKCLIFDKKYQKQVYGKEMTLIDQLKMFNLNKVQSINEIKKLSFDLEEKTLIYTSNFALKFYEILENNNIEISNILNQISFFGRRDGEVIVVYNDNVIIPIAYVTTFEYPDDYDQSDNDGNVKWIKINLNKQVINNLFDNM